LNKPSVALVSLEFGNVGGVGSYTQDLACLLSERKFSTTVFCGKSHEAEKQSNEYLTIVQLPMLDVPLRGYWFQILNYSSLVQRLHDFDIIHAISPHSSALCALIKHEHQRMITTIHNVPIFSAKKFFDTPPSDWAVKDVISHLMEISVGWKLSALCYSKSERIVCVSETARQQAKLAFGKVVNDKTTVIPNGVPFGIVGREQHENLREGDTEESLLFYGRLVTLKGIPLLLRSIALLRSKFPKIKLTVAGSGPLADKLQMLSRKLGIVDNIDFRGYMSRRDLMTVVNGSSIVVLPSYHEGGLGLAVLEAMARGKPVVALDYPFMREVIKNFETGLLALPDETDLARKIELLIEDEDLRAKLGRNARNRVYQDFNLDKLIERYITLYRSLAEQL